MQSKVAVFSSVDAGLFVGSDLYKGQCCGWGLIPIILGLSLRCLLFLFVSLFFVFVFCFLFFFLCFLVKWWIDIFIFP